MACTHLRADTYSETSISLCICLNTSQEVGAENAPIANKSDTELLRQKERRNWKTMARASKLDFFFQLKKLCAMNP